MLKIIFVLFLTSFVSSQVQDINRFPLLGSTWLIGKGQNPRIHASFGKSIPTHLILITFPDSFSVTKYLLDTSSVREPFILIQYANLNGREYRSTYELMRDAKNQFLISKNNLRIPLSKVNSQQDSLPNHTILFTLARRTLADTICACENDFINSDSRYTKFGFDLNGEEFYYNSRSEIDASKPKWQHGSPTAWGVISQSNRANMYTQPDPDPNISKFYKSTAASESGGWIDYCQDGSCYEQIPCTQKKTAPIQFWQIHITPDIRWYPRDIFSGEPKIIDTLKMTLEKTLEMKKRSIDNPNTVDLKYYRNPYFSDSASCYASISFFDNVLAGEKPMNQRDYIDLRHLPDENNKKSDEPSVDLYIDHIPSRMVRIKSIPNAIERAIVTLYADTDEEFYAQDSLYNACFNWKFNDEEIGKLRYPDNLQVKNQSLHKSPTFDEVKYQYFGCPCLGITELNGYTKAQMRKFIYQSPPMCSYKEMCKAMYIYKKTYYYCENVKDRMQVVNNIVLLHASIVDRERFINKNKLPKSEVDLINANCPPSWTQNFPDYLTSYTTDFRSSAEKLVTLVKIIRGNSINRTTESKISYINSNW